MRIIDADALLAEFDRREAEPEYQHEGEDWYCGLISGEELVMEAPTIEPERKKGEWIYKNDLKQFFCSKCGFPSLTSNNIYIYGMDLPNYCEDCGADMRTSEDK